jgi:hypothetical protein
MYRSFMAFTLFGLALAGGCRKSSAPVDDGPADGPRLKIEVGEAGFKGDKSAGTWALPVTVVSYAEWPIQLRDLSFRVLDRGEERCSHKQAVDAEVPVGGRHEVKAVFTCGFVAQPTIEGAVVWVGPKGEPVTRRFSETTQVNP